MSIDRTQLIADRSAFWAQAKASGLQLGSIRAQALAGLPADATDEQKRTAVQSAIQGAVDANGNPELIASRDKLNADRQQMQGQGLLGKGRGRRGGRPHGKPPGAGGNATIDEVIAKGSRATVAEVEDVLNGLDSNHPKYATLRSMLATAQAKEQRQQTTTGHSLNLMA